MRPFRKYILEQSANKHLDHIEDLVFHGTNEIRDSIKMLIALRNGLAGHSKQQLNITTKFDGAPAIICGINPENGKFFVATKSLFNKTPKINYTPQDIDNNHPDYLADKLKLCLYLLPKVIKKGIYQGDFLYSKADLRSVDIDGEKYISFRPNTITYAVPSSSAIANTITKADLGIVFHTTYTGNSIATLSASFSVNKSAFSKISSVWVPDIQFRNTSGAATLTLQETGYISQQLSLCGKIFASLDAAFINSLSRDSKVTLAMKTYINSQIRAGNELNGSREYFNGLLQFVKLGIEAKKYPADTLDYIQNNSASVINLFYLAELVSAAKELLLNKMQSISALKTFLKTPDGYKVTAPEGFVASDTISGNVIKLVDRLEFSRSNFNMEKDWK